MSGTASTTIIVNGAVVYNDADFRARFPYFANVTTYPQAQLQMFFNMGTTIVSNSNYGYLTGADLITTMYLMTAHLLQIQTNLIANNGSPGGNVTQATIDKISISIQAPVVKTAWAQWLQQTAWGQQLFAMLQIKGAGGFFASGRFENRAFRRAYGRFG